MLRTLCPLVLISVVAGCDSRHQGQVGVVGNVRHHGEPIPEGRVLFTPNHGNDGRAAGASIQDGQFNIPAESGPDLGSYQITVSTGALEEKNGSKHPGTTNPAVTSKVSERFSFERVLRSESGQVQLDFDLSEAD